MRNNLEVKNDVLVTDGNVTINENLNVGKEINADHIESTSSES